MRGTSLAVVALAIALPAVGRTQERDSSRDGRWVARGTLLAYVIDRDFVELFAYPPQAPLASYKVSFNGVEIAIGGTRTWHTFAVVADTLDLTTDGQKMRFLRIAGPRDTTRALVGSWRALTASTPRVHTYRSDGAFVMELGPALPQQLNGDTLVARMQDQEVRARLMRVGSTLRIQPLRRGSVQILERRPWGCYGIPPFDKEAKECK